MTHLIDNTRETVPQRPVSRNSSHEGASQLHRASKDGNLQEIIKLLASTEDVNSKDQFGSTALHLCCFSGHLECVKQLLQAPNIDINAKDVFNRTPAFYAARNGHTAILELLIRKEADVTLRTETGETALTKASYYGHLPCLKLLLSVPPVKQKIDEGDALGNTALHNASMRGHLDCIQYLLSEGANVNSVNLNGATPLHLAVTYKQTEAVKLLLSCGATTNTKSNSNKSPLDEASTFNFKEIAELLRKASLRSQVEDLKKKKDVMKWSAYDVAKWLAIIGYSQYKDVFISNDIKGRSLSSLNMTILKQEFNIASYGHRTSILENINRLLRDYKKEKEKKQQQQQEQQQQQQTTPPTSPVKDTDTAQHSPLHPHHHHSASVSSSSFSPAEQQQQQHQVAVDPAVWTIDYHDLNVLEILGKGYFGEVRKAIWKGTTVAVKVIYRESYINQEDIMLFYKELNIVSKLRHPNVLMFIGACLQGENRCLVTEYLSGGNLYMLIHNNWDTLLKNPHLKYRIALDVIRGMTYLHELKILHRDLTTKNLLLDGNMNCKVCDFGLSRIRDDTGTMTTNLGCLPFQAPEVFRGEKYNDTADVYSFGMVLYELATGNEPHKGHQPLKFANMVAYENYRPSLPSSIGEKWERLIQWCWHSDPAKRPSFQALLHEIQTEEPTKPTTTVAAVDYSVGT